MTKFYEILLKSVFVGVLLSFEGCIFEYPDPSCFDDVSGSLVVRYDWNEASAYTPAGHYRDPDGMAVLLYPPEADDYWRFDIPSAGGGIDAREGLYTVVSFNNDTGNIRFFDDKSLSDFYVSTSEGNLSDGITVSRGVAQPPRPYAAFGERVLTQPEMFWVSVVRDVEVPSLTPPPDTLDMSPLPVVARYEVTVDDIENLSSAFAYSMSISGLAAGFRFDTFSRLDEKVIVPGSLAKRSSTSIAGSLLTFGMPEKLPHTSVLSLYFWLRDGSKLMFEFGVADFISDAPNPLDVHISVKGVSLPSVEGGSGSGMDVGVDNWDIIDIELST